MPEVPTPPAGQRTWLRRQKSFLELFKVGRRASLPLAAETLSYGAKLYRENAARQDDGLYRISTGDPCHTCDGAASYAVVAAIPTTSHSHGSPKPHMHNAISTIDVQTYRPRRDDIRCQHGPCPTSFHHIDEGISRTSPSDQPAIIACRSFSQRRRNLRRARVERGSWRPPRFARPTPPIPPA